MATIHRFIGRSAFLSNFYEHPVRLHGDTFPSAENAFQSRKIHLSTPRLDHAALIARFKSDSPRDAKRLGRKVKLRDDWEECKIDVMHDVLWAKFEDPELRQQLLDTGDAELTEGNTWGDTFWGVCNGVGENHLGKQLMKVRDGIRALDLLFAVSIPDLNAWGCSHCGFQSGSTPISGCGGGEWRCGECHKTTFFLDDGYTESRFTIGGKHIPLKKHPRHGTPKHGKPDKRPETGGEYFRSRGLGRDWTKGCFVCGGDPDGLYHNVAAFVQHKDAGERIVRMFERGARLDYRENYPDRIQVKIGACDQHHDRLEALSRATEESGVITQELVDRHSLKMPELVRKYLRWRGAPGSKQSYSASSNLALNEWLWEIAKNDPEVEDRTILEMERERNAHIEG